LLFFKIFARVFTHNDLKDLQNPVEDIDKKEDKISKKSYVKN